MDFILLNIIIMIGFVKVFIGKRSFINSTSLKLWWFSRFFVGTIFLYS